MYPVANKIHQTKKHCNQAFSLIGMDCFMDDRRWRNLTTFHFLHIIEKYLALFCKKSDTAMQYVQKWMPIVAASQSVKGNEKEREFLLSWVNVVDYE